MSGRGAEAESFERAGFHPALLGRAYDVIKRFADEGKIPGGVAQVGTSEHLLPPFAYGDASWEPVRRPARADTIYDCASLTKVVVTTTLALGLVEQGKICLDDRVAEWIPEFLELAPDDPGFGDAAGQAAPGELAADSGSGNAGVETHSDNGSGSAGVDTNSDNGSGNAAVVNGRGDAAVDNGPGNPASGNPASGNRAGPSGRSERSVRRGVTVRHLLTHTSGLAAWAPLYQRGRGPTEILEALCREPLAREPGTGVIYSCLGFILLGTLIEREEGTTLDRLAEERIFGPLGMKDSGFNLPPSLFERIAPTEKVGERVIHGVVHDENARGRGGVSGNAGLFSTAPDLSRFAQAILRLRRGKPAAFAPPGAFLSPVAVQASTRNYTEGMGEPRGLGWLLRSQTMNPCGDLFGAESFGHTGFTGTSLWIDPGLDLFVVLLTNRVHPTRENTAHLRLRPLFHNAVAAARALGG